MHTKGLKKKKYFTALLHTIFFVFTLLHSRTDLPKYVYQKKEEKKWERICGSVSEIGQKSNDCIYYIY